MMNLHDLFVDGLIERLRRSAPANGSELIERQWRRDGQYVGIDDQAVCLVENTSGASTRTIRKIGGRLA
jgi:hypothetical protein